MARLAKRPKKMLKPKNCENVIHII